MLYSPGGELQRDLAPDRPPHVRAASGIAPFGSGFAVVQDDASFVALLSADGITSIPLPAGPDGRRTFAARLGNTEHKLDLEAIVALEGGKRAVAFGSGATPRRERLVVLDEVSRQPTMLDGHELYERLRSTPELEGSELNIEAAIATGSRLVLFQRGNGRRGAAVNAVIEMDRAGFVEWLDGTASLGPPLAVRAVDLGREGDVAYGFTDAVAIDGGALFVAVAEASPDTVRDGPVAGARIGVLDAHGARWVELDEADGTRSTKKVEGIAIDPADPSNFVAVTDPDDPDVPAQKCRIRVRGLLD